jgi:Ras-related protein Rab-8A
MDSRHLQKKVVLLGDSGVGKTSLIRRFVVDRFDDKQVATIGSKIMRKDIEYKLPGRTIFLTMQIWDVLGQREFRKIRSAGIKGASGIILVADLTNQESILGMVEFWHPQVHEVEGEVPAIVVGNKSDLLPADAPALHQLASAAGEISAPYFYCSAKTGTNVESAFRAMGDFVIGSSAGSSDTEGIGESPSMSSALDFIIHDFCDQYGDFGRGMEAAEKIAAATGLDISAPTKDSSLETIEMMADSEKDRLGNQIAEVNKMRRWRILEESTAPK